ncbi:MAG TPA: ABC transporter permease [Thermoanaerobaculia bacterium]|nr:ABC transporter permease [Thermoanaerobaculia bacterium]
MSQLLELTLLAGAPLLLAVIGELILQRSGVLNIGLEGMLLAAAFGATLAGATSGSALGGIAGGVAGAAAAAALFGALALWRAADPIVSGVALNLLCLGATGVLYRELNEGNRLVEGLPRLPRLSVGAMEIDAVVFFAWVVAPLMAAALLWRTRAGLRMRAAGENPDALAWGGRSVARARWLALAFEVVLAGFAGAALSLGLAQGFAENMVAGRGFIALAIVIFARWSVAGAVAGVALFSFATALQYAIQAGGSGIAFHLLLGFPYVATLAFLVVAPGSVQAPRALGRPYPS